MDLLLLLSTGNIWQNEEIDHLGYISEDDEENLVLTFHAQLQHDFINNKHPEIKNDSTNNLVEYNNKTGSISSSSDISSLMKNPDLNKPSLPVFLYHTCVGILEHLIMVFGGREMYVTSHFYFLLILLLLFSVSSLVIILNCMCNKA